MNLHDWYKRVDIASQQATRQRGTVQTLTAPDETETPLAPASSNTVPASDTGPERPASNAAKSREGKPRKMSLRRVEGERGASVMDAETREQLLSRLLDPILSLEEAAKVLNVCPTTVRRYTNSGALAHLRTQGNQRRFLLSDVLAFLKSQQEGTPRMTAIARQRRAYPGEAKGNIAELERGS